MCDRYEAATGTDWPRVIAALNVYAWFPHLTEYSNNTLFSIFIISNNCPFEVGFVDFIRV